MNDAQPYDHQLPDTLNTSGAKLVYLYLQVEDEATINELHTALGMKKITLYSLLQTLTATELVDQEGAMYVCRKQKRSVEAPQA